MIETEELPAFYEAQRYCFFIDPGPNPWWENRVVAEETRGIFDEEGGLKAGLINFPFAVNLEGARLAMGGIAGVVSWPEQRRGGNVGDLLISLLHEEHAKGVPLSGLYPFKQSFYRRYGWEVAAAWLRHEIPVDLLAPCRAASGTVERLAPGKADWRVLEELYAAVAARRNGFMVRETEHFWTHVVLPHWDRYDLQFHTALWRPAAGARPEGYLLYRFGKDDKGERQLVTKELIALTPAAERGLWGFVAQHDSQVRTVTYRTPRDYPLWHLVEHTYEVKSTMHSGWMLRFVDVAAAFTARPWGGAPDSSFAIGVTDEHLPWNNGTFRLTFESGHASLVPAPAETPAVSADQRIWAQIYAGFVRPSQALAAGRLTCADPGALRALELATAGKEMWYYEFY